MGENQRSPAGGRLLRTQFLVAAQGAGSRVPARVACPTESSPRTQPAHMTRSDHSRRGCPSASDRRGERREWERDQGAARADAQRCNRYDQAGEVEAWWEWCPITLPAVR